MTGRLLAITRYQNPILACYIITHRLFKPETFCLHKLPKIQHHLHVHIYLSSLPKIYLRIKNNHHTLTVTSFPPRSRQTNKHDEEPYPVSIGPRALQRCLPRPNQIHHRTMRLLRLLLFPPLLRPTLGLQAIRNRLALSGQCLQHPRRQLRLPDVTETRRSDHQIQIHREDPHLVPLCRRNPEIYVHNLHRAGIGHTGEHIGGIRPAGERGPDSEREQHQCDESFDERREVGDSVAVHVLQ